MSSKKIKITRYKVVNINIDKKFIGKNLDLQRIKSKGGNGSGERKPGSTNKITLAKLSNKVDTLANRVDTLTKNVDSLTNRVDTLTKNVDTLTNNLNKLVKIVTDGFANINHRIDNLVKVNNLKE